jgi:hypothetical protein
MAFEPLPLNEETHANLLNEGTERDGLDFKSVCDLKIAGDKVELTKDLGAMLMRGGYIVIGADDRGHPTAQVTDAHAKLFDQATLHDKVKPYLADGFEIRSTAERFPADPANFEQPAPGPPQKPKSQLPPGEPAFQRRGRDSNPR